MPIINKVEKTGTLDRWQVVKFQLSTYCFLNGLSLSDADLNCLTLLATDGKSDLNVICKKIHDQKIFKSVQTARNSLIKAENSSLVFKEGKSRKKVWLNPDLMIQTEGNILLNYKFVALEV
jgi:hypothetical protein